MSHYPARIAGGSVAGSAHVRAGRNNQDAFAWTRSSDGLVAVVCDGCGSAPRSDVGASLGARLLVHAVRPLLGAGMSPEVLLERARGHVLASLRVLACSMSHDGSRERGRGESFVETVADYLLFTIVGVVIDAGLVTTFALGDGLIVVNGERRVLGPFAGNEPPYLAYELIDGARRPRAFVVHAPLPARELDSLLLGTDGIFDLEELEELAPLWREDRYFDNPDMTRRHLATVQRGAHGRSLPDDTTLIVLRGAREREEAS